MTGFEKQSKAKTTGSFISQLVNIVIALTAPAGMFSGRIFLHSPNQFFNTNPIFHSFNQGLKFDSD
jgi:hypothetical protein